jgi:hypothetical protein
MWGTRMAHRRSLGFARDDKKEMVVGLRKPMLKGEDGCSAAGDAVR